MEAARLQTWPYRRRSRVKVSMTAEPALRLFARGADWDARLDLRPPIRFARLKAPISHALQMRVPRNQCRRAHDQDQHARGKHLQQEQD
jgi:hypothetical protein